MSDTLDVIMAVYATQEPARRDFDALVQLIKHKTVRSEGVILVARDEEGQVQVTHTADHLGRTGVGWGGGVGVLVGLFSPPLLASAVVGGAVGGLVGRFAKHRQDSGIEKGIGDQLAPGTAAVIAICDADDRLPVERALGGAVDRSVASMHQSGMGDARSTTPLPTGQ
jgi:uncharacterized membrane protein